MAAEREAWSNSMLIGSMIRTNESDWDDKTVSDSWMWLTLLSVELQILNCFSMPFLHHAFFPSLFLRFPTGLSKISFLQFPHFPNDFLDFPWLFHAFLQGNGFFTTFRHFPLFPPSFFRCFFSWFFSTSFLPLSGDLGRCEPHSHQIAVWYMPPSKNSKWTPWSPPNFEISGSLGNVPPYTHFVRENNFA